MAIILSLETATPVCSIAIHENGSLLAKTTIHKDQSHSSLLNTSVDSLLNLYGLDYAHLDAVAVSKGPGSYTGLRIGTSSAKGFCYSLNIPLIAVNTLEAMAHGVNKFNPYNALLCPMLDARRMEVYALIMSSTGELIRNTEAIVLDETSFENDLKSNEILFFGSGANKYFNLTDNVNAKLIENVSPDAENIGELAYEKWKTSSFEDLAYFEPFYLKEFMAIKPKSML
jgi:tRNA threonylcarbamoyladenosine biosynthesis protein TsaB